MKIKNISSEILILAARKLIPQETCSVEEDFVYGYVEYADDFINAFNDNKVQFFDDEMEVLSYTDVLNYFKSPVIQSNKGTSNNEDFYYNYKMLSMNSGDVKDYKFEGLLKTLDVFSKTGDIEVQIIEPMMNKIQVPETSNYNIYCDYKLKNPIIRITCKRRSDVVLYMDGSYTNTLKTKNQYLAEIYSDTDFPEASSINTNLLQFKTNFKKPMKSELFVDTIGKYAGQTFNNSTLLNFNRFEDGSYVKFGDICKLQDDFTFILWDNIINDIISTQTLYYKKGTLEITIENGVFSIAIGDKLVQVPGLKLNKWQMISITKNNDVYSFYINDTRIITTVLDVNFSTSSENVYFGCKTPGTNSVRSLELGECLLYNYHFSQGMIKYMYMNNHPDLQIQTNLLPGCYLSKYTNTSSIVPSTAYDFSMIEKENTRIGKMLTSEVVNTLSTTNNTGEISIFNGKVYIPEDGKYTITTTGEMVSVVMDDKTVLLNSSSTTQYFEEGYYRFKTTICGQGLFNITISNTTSSASIYIEDYDDMTSTPEESSILFDTGNKTSTHGITFEGNDNEVFTEDDVLTIKNIPNKINSDNFNISFDLDVIDNDATIIGQGYTYEPNFEIRLTDLNLVFTHQGYVLKSPKLLINEKYNIQITSNGSMTYMYVNASLVSSADVKHINRLISTDNIYIGRLAGNIQAAWCDGSFKISKFKWYLKYFTENEIINNYIKNKA